MDEGCVVGVASDEEMAEEGTSKEISTPRTQFKETAATSKGADKGYRLLMRRQ